MVARGSSRDSDLNSKTVPAPFLCDMSVSDRECKRIDPRERPKRDNEKVVLTDGVPVREVEVSVSLFDYFQLR